MSDPVRHMPKVVGMHIPDEIINQATATALREVMVGSHFKQESWAAAAGMSYVTVQKLLSGKQSVKVPQLLALARASNFTPEEVMERINRAVQRAVSDAASNVTPIRPNQSPKGGAQEDFDGQARAAHRDVELDEDEPGARWRSRGWSGRPVPTIFRARGTRPLTTTQRPRPSHRERCKGRGRFVASSVARCKLN